MVSLKQLKTPVRYPGGKSKATNKMDPYFPDFRNYNEFREPFVGGGSVAIHITKKYSYLNIWVNDLYEPLVNFWQVLQKSPDELFCVLEAYKKRHNTPDTARELFNQMKVDLNDEETPTLQRAAAFYVINKCSFSGLTESSSFSSQASVSNFSMRGIEKLPEYSKLIEKWRITNYSYDYLMNGNKSAFIYLDPPYDIKDNLYGNKGSMHKGFDHNKFVTDCDSHNMDTMISYNSTQLIKERFKNWTPIEFDLTYTMRSTGDYMSEQKGRKELLLINYNNIPKIQTVFDGCYNYNRLKKEGLVNEV